MPVIRQKNVSFPSFDKKKSDHPTISFDLKYSERATRWEPRRMSSAPHEGPRRSSRKPQNKTIPRAERKPQRKQRQNANMTRFVDAVHASPFCQTLKTDLVHAQDHTEVAAVEVREETRPPATNPTDSDPQTPYFALNPTPTD